MRTLLVAARTPLAFPPPLAGGPLTPVCEPDPALLRAQAARIQALASACVQWVGQADAVPPPDRITDADFLLLAVVERWLQQIAVRPQAAAVDVLALAAALVAHPAKAHLCGLSGAAFTPSPSWPHSATPRKGPHKAVLDRYRKMHAAGLVELDKRPAADGAGLFRAAYDYYVTPRQAGVVRAVYLANRIGYRLPIIHDAPPAPATPDPKGIDQVEQTHARPDSEQMTAGAGDAHGLATLDAVARSAPATANSKQINPQRTARRQRPRASRTTTTTTVNPA